ncbi:hypothetical protein AAG906_012916 [Vitis piasezkii]
MSPLVVPTSPTNNHHRRAVAASLPSRWWNFFHFQLKRALIDDKDSSIYGVVYEIKHTYLNHLPNCAPKYVIAFRGTILKLSTLRRDVKLNIKVWTDELHMDKFRFKPALEAVQQAVQEAGSANIWLAGHSWGQNNMTNLMHCLLGSPTFVNRHDPICLEYIGHFRNRNTVEKIVGTFGILGERNPAWGVLKAAVGMDPQLPIQLLPKAYLTISDNSSSCNFVDAHGLRQWWHQMSKGPGFEISRKPLISDPVLVGGP